MLGPDSLAGSSTDDINVHPEGLRADEGLEDYSSLPHLLDLLEAESSGLSVAWQGLDDRKNAIAARLAIFQGIENIGSHQPPSGPLEAATQTGNCPLPWQTIAPNELPHRAHVLHREEAYDRARVPNRPNSRPLIIDDLLLDEKRCRPPE